MMKMQPLGDRAILKLVEAQQTTASGIILTTPEKVTDVFEIIVIIDHPTLKIWDKVVCGQYSGDNVKVDGKDLKIVKYDDILGVFNQ